MTDISGMDEFLANNLEVAERMVSSKNKADQQLGRILLRLNEPVHRLIVEECITDEENFIPNMTMYLTSVLMEIGLRAAKISTPNSMTNESARAIKRFILDCVSESLDQFGNATFRAVDPKNIQ